MPEGSVTLETVIKRSDDLLASDLDRETVMMDVESGSYFGLNEVGSRIWALTEEAISVKDICAKLGEEFNVDAETCQKDVLSFLDGMLEKKVVVPA